MLLGLEHGCTQDRIPFFGLETHGDGNGKHQNHDTKSPRITFLGTSLDVTGSLAAYVPT